MKMGKTPVFVRFIDRNINLEYKQIGHTLGGKSMSKKYMLIIFFIIIPTNLNLASRIGHFLKCYCLTDIGLRENNI
jgi:hypothetical protein